MTTDTFLDAREITLWRSPSGLLHVGAWFGQVACGAFVDSHNGWSMEHLTSLRHLGRMSRRSTANRMCKRCAAQYKDVRDD